jgi:hypothetical protein
MERRDRSLKALNDLQYIDTLDHEIRGKNLEKWVGEFLNDENFLNNLELNRNELERFSELFYKNINFLKNQKQQLQEQLKENQQIKKFFT